MHRVRALPIAAVLALVAAPAVSSRADAQTMFVANLTTDQEPVGAFNFPTIGPGNTGAARPTPYGFATFMLNAAQTQLTMNVTVFNLDFTGTQTPGTTNDNLTAAHIHSGPNGPTPNPPGFTNPVSWGFHGAPFNDLNSPTAALMTDCVPLVGGVGGTCSGVWDVNEGNGGRTLTSELPHIFAGRAYVNFHTVQNPGGEIRGAIAVVPEPSTYLLMATGFAGIGLVAWRRRRA